MVDAGAVNPPEDFFRLGCVFYRCVTGQAPFAEKDLPQPAHVISGACGAAPVGTAAAADAATRPKEHDVVSLLTSGYLERLGFRYEPATPARTWRRACAGSWMASWRDSGASGEENAKISWTRCPSGS